MQLTEEIWGKWASYSIPVPLSNMTNHFGIKRKLRAMEKNEAGLLDLRERPFIMILNSNDSEGRRRFTEGHELGHFYLHDLGDILHRDTALTVFDLYESNTDSAHFIQELEASAFAAGLLMPTTPFTRDMKIVNINAPLWISLAEKYGVSPPAARQQVFRLTPAPCFQGVAFANTGMIICAYPSLLLESTHPSLADRVWFLNRKGDFSSRAFLPTHLFPAFWPLKRRRVQTSNAVLRETIDASIFFPEMKYSPRGLLTLRQFDSQQLYFCFDLEETSRRTLRKTVLASERRIK